MKRIVKNLLKALWRMTSPVRRPLVARFNAHVSRIVSGTVNERMMPELLQPLAVALKRLERIEESLARAEHSASAAVEEVDLVLNGVSREIFRLQAQVESLHGLIHREIREARNGLSILDASEDDEPTVRRAPAADRARVG